MQSLFAPIDTNPSGLTVLVTAGPTQEPIDPVRYISNHSTGKMGYALAQILADRGATVTLVSGPTHLVINHPAIRVVRVHTAAQMYEAYLVHFSIATLTVLSAAVADYTPKVVANRKIKKKESDGRPAEFYLELVKTVNIAASLGAQKSPDQYLVGFALETDGD